MKKKVLLSAILSIVLCLSLIAGSTFALFTSETKVDIVVSAGKVSMVADLSNVKLASVRPATYSEINNKEIVKVADENNELYVYVDREGDTFANGGTAKFEGGVLTLDKVTPGDKVSFNVEGANESDVSVRYRYVFECIGDQKLMSGLLVTIGGDTYSYLGSYTSEWMTLEPGADMASAPIVIEFPVSAGNEFQEKSTKIKVTVEAVQGNAAVDTTATALIEFLDTLPIDLKDKVISGVGVTNTETVDLVGGTVEVDYVGFQNWGDAKLNGTVIEAGTSGIIAYGYAVNSYAGSTTVLNDVTVNSANGVLSATYGAKLTVNGGSYVMNAKSTSGRYVVYTEGEGSVVTINGGDFTITPGQNDKRAYVYASKGTTVTINGGNFAAFTPRKGYSLFMGDGEIVITGGTFGFDPSAWVADGCKVVKESGVWTVSVDVADLKDSLANGENVVLKNDVTVDNVADYGSNGYGKTALNVNGQTFDGNGFTLEAPKSNGTWDSAIGIKGGTIKNLTIGSGFRGIFVTGSEKVYLDNVTIDGPTYTISCDSANYGGLEAVNSTFNGWTSYAAKIGDVKFENCSFGKGAGYAYCRPYAPTEFVGCDFEKGYKIDARAAITFENCTIAGEPLTEENLATLVTSNLANASVK